MSEHDAVTPIRMTKTQTPEKVAIIGGGIAGLFCAYILASEGHIVELFESSDVLGGRIRSFRFSDSVLNDLERKDDADRKPVKGEATLAKSLRPELLKPAEAEPGYVPSAGDKLKRQPEPGGGSSTAGTSSSEHGDANPPPDRAFTTEGYDKRAWDHLEFNAEFGPMRIELEVQRMLSFLLRHLNIPPLNAGPPDEIGTADDLVRMQRFPPFSSPASAGDPIYDLAPEEEGKNPLELLKFGVCRAVVDLHFDFEKAPLKDASSTEHKKVEAFEEDRKELFTKLNNAAATQRPIIPVFEAWVRTYLHEDDYWVIQRYGQIPVLYGPERYIKLYTMGFWNLLAAYLSHNALGKVRELGTFYHLIPENPNAAEWLTWWMRQISISSHLEGVFGGMQSVIEKLLTAMGITETSLTTTNLTIHLNSTVTSLRSADGDIDVSLRDGEPHTGFRRVILALPTVPAEKLIQSSHLWITDLEQDDKTRFTDYLHSALPFQLLKAFFVVRERWWEEDVRANAGATRYPTREVYFWKSRMANSRRGLVMLYTDRPAATFWANYVPKPTQEDIDELCRDPQAPIPGEDKAVTDSIPTLRARIKSRFVEYVQENEGVPIAPDDIIWCGIMDWGREPYGAASHTWRPNREYWNTLAQLADWELPATNDKPPTHLHVCGEAYSDYHAFIEGALRSAVHVLTQIRADPDGKRDRLSSIVNVLLDTQLPQKHEKLNFKKVTACSDGTLIDDKKVTDDDLTKDEKYVKDFLDWSEKLDDIRNKS